MGRDELPARVDRRRAALRQARRSLRPEDRPAGGDRDLPRGLGPVRPEPEHVPADRLPSAPGVRGRRADRRDDRGDRGRRLTARARPLPGLLRRGLRRVDRDRPAARRLLRRQPLVALDLLRQHPDRARRARRDRIGLPRAGRARSACGGLPRRGAPRRRSLGDRAVHEPRRHDVRLGRTADDRAGRRRGALPRRVRGRREQGEGADLAARASSATASSRSRA